jgi:hypothetical protein
MNKLLQAKTIINYAGTTSFFYFFSTRTIGYYKKILKNILNVSSTDKCNSDTTLLGRSEAKA